MSEQIFAQFPSARGEGAYHLIDITKIEAIGQSNIRQVCAIFGPTERYYAVEVETEALDEGNFPDATSYCYQIMENAVAEVNPPAPGERDDEDDFGDRTELDAAIRRVVG